MRIVLTVLAAVGVGGYAPGDYPCKGVAPNGRRWLFVMPQHTGTSVVASLLRGLIFLGDTPTLERAEASGSPPLEPEDKSG